MIGAHPDWSTVVVYPALTPLPLIDQNADNSGGQLFGRTRAAVLRSDRPRAHHDRAGGQA